MSEGTTLWVDNGDGSDALASIDGAGRLTVHYSSLRPHLALLLARWIGRMYHTGISTAWTRDCGPQCTCQTWGTTGWP